MFQVILGDKPAFADLDAAQSSSAHFLVNLPSRNPDNLGRLLNAQRQTVGQRFRNFERTLPRVRWPGRVCDVASASSVQSWSVRIPSDGGQ
jgi:hypothetical protein